ncbi:MAG: bacteriohemerythrin [Sulfurimonas sp.]|jgi:diguanylate cyclase (GGDEF)-like protein/hemerythrin-like metal-binding protein
MVQWDDGLSVGIEILDNDHKRLLSIINQLSSAIDANVEKDILENIFTELEVYALTHFKSEESYIEKCNKESLITHQEQHNSFLLKIPELKAKLLNTNDYIVAQDTTIYLSDWLVGHIISEDIPLIRFFENCELAQDNKNNKKSLFKRLVKKITDSLSFTKRIFYSVLIPLSGMFFFGSIILWNNYKNYEDMKSASSIIYTISNINVLAHNIQIERGLSSGYLTSIDNKFDNNLQKQKIIVDNAIVSFIKKFETVDKDKLIAIQSYISIFQKDILSLNHLRNDVNNKKISQIDAINAYSEIIKNILSITPQIAFLNIDGTVSSSISTLSSVLFLKEALGQQRAYGTMIIEKKNANRDEYISFMQLLGIQKSFLYMFELTATQNEINIINTVFTSVIAKQISEYEEKLKNSDFENLNSEIWFDSFTKLIEDVKKVEDQLLHKVNDLIDHRIINTIQNLFLWIIFNTLILAITFFILYTLKRSATKQIIQLTDAMKDLASGGRSFRLSPIMINRDEIACMYDAYETTRQRLLKGDVYTQLYKNKKDIEVKNQQRENSKLEEMAFIDPLTGTLNRRKFEEVSERELKHSKRYNHSLTFLMMDIDHFKNINDSYGHAIGDEVLKHFTTICKKIARDIDIVARFGGEEFVIILRETDENGAFNFSERLRSEVYNSSVVVNNQIIKYSVSIGIASLEDDKNTKTILQRADEALYEAKKSGRNRTVVYKKSTL